MTPPHCSLNRRGSRSEGRLNLALQERLADPDRRKPCEDITVVHKPKPLPPVCTIKADCRPRSAQDAQLRQPLNMNKIKNNTNFPRGLPRGVTTTFITEASTISIPVITHTPVHSQTTPKYKTMPSPTRTTAPGPLNEIFEEGDSLDNISLATRQASRQLVSRSQHRSSYEQRRSKFHKSRTASCSSSDASDDDSENRKKRAHKLNTAPSTGKPLQGKDLTMYIELAIVCCFMFVMFHVLLYSITEIALVDMYRFFFCFYTIGLINLIIVVNQFLYCEVFIISSLLFVFVYCTYIYKLRDAIRINGCFFD